MRGIIVCVGLVLMCWGGPVQAQVPEIFPDTVIGAPAGTDSTKLPVPVQPRRPFSPVLKASTLTLAGAGLWVLSFAYVDEPLQKAVQAHPSGLADKAAAVFQPLGRQHNLVPLAGAVFVGGMLTHDPRLEKVGALSVGSIMLSSGVTAASKQLFHRYRPSETSENHIFGGPPQGSGNTSLPSAHTATAFAMATSIDIVYGKEHAFVRPVAYGVATLVGLSRINDNAHWATDVMAGALVGYVSAKGTNYLYQAVHHRLNHRRQQLLITPQVGAGSGGISTTLVF